MWGISGDVGDDLLETLAKQAALKQQQEEMRMRAQQIAEQQRQFNENLALQRQREENDQGRHRDDMSLRTRAIDLDELQRRDRNNETGLEQRTRDRAAWEGEQQGREQEAAANDPNLPPALRTVLGLQKRGFKVGTDDLLTDEQRRANALTAYEKEKQIDARYDRSGGSEGKQWVTGADGQTYHRTPIAGDVPREKGSPETADTYAAERASRTVQSVDELMGQVSKWTVGYGSALSALPESDARSFAAQLKTLKASIAFNELSAMRAASKTGGALGNVSNVELALLESALGALDQAQTPAQFRVQLQKIRDSVTRWQEAASGGRPAGPGAEEPRMNRTGAPASPQATGETVIEYVRDPRTGRNVRRP